MGFQHIGYDERKVGEGDGFLRISKFNDSSKNFLQIFLHQLNPQ